MWQQASVIIYKRKSTKTEKLLQDKEHVSHQRSFKIRCWRRRPGWRYNAVDWVLLLRVDVLHVERRAILGLALGLLGVQAAVHATVAILRKECVDGFYSGLWCRI